MSKLLELMKTLGSDARLSADYAKDPEGVIRRAGLSEAEAQAMLTSDYDTIRKLTGLAEGQFATNHIIKAYEK